MSEKPQAKNSLMAMELEVEAEGREWMRQRLEQKLQAEADREGLIFPPQRKKGAPPQAPKDASAQRGGRR